jgi:hypothetical protein
MIRSIEKETKRDNQTIIVGLSGNDSYREEAMNYMDDFFIKPVAPATIFDQIQKPKGPA